MPEISIIVPVYNVEKYIRRCIDSLIAQTFNEIEILLIDDGSKDDSGAICDKYALKDNRIKAIHKENGGVSSARNAGLDNAAGTYIMFCDPDDYVESTWCEKLYSVMQKGNISCAFCGYNSVKMSGEIKHTTCICNEGLTSIKKLYSSELIFCVWNKIFILAEIKQNNINFDESISKAEDSIFVLRYLQVKTGNIINVPEPLYNYAFDMPKSLTKRAISENWNLSCRFFKEVRKTMEIYKVSFSEYSDIYYSNVIAAILQSLNVLFDFNFSTNDLFVRGKGILNSEECKEAFKYGSFQDIHPIYKIILKTRCFFLVWLFHWAVKLKHWLVGKNTYAKR